MKTSCGRLLVVAIIALVGGCKSKREGLEQAATYLCEAAKAALDPPEEAYVKFAAKMKVDRKEISKQARSVVGADAFVDSLKQKITTLAAPAAKTFTRIFSASVAVDPSKKYGYFRTEFATHGVSLECPELKRWLSFGE